MKRGSSIALGFFDGVHIAHQEVIKSATEYARNHKLTPIALTFDKSPLEILAPQKVSYLTDLSEKICLIEALGAYTYALPLSKELLQMSAEEFVRDILVKKYNIKHAVCGYNYCFGKDGLGKTKLLCSLGEKYGFSVSVCHRLTCGKNDISSSRIRTLISEGFVKEAGMLLGRPFHLGGIVSKGKRLGTHLGFPTANVFFKPLMTVPKNGVYKTRVKIGQDTYNAITNIGINPTIGKESFHSETHIPGFSEDIYEKHIDIDFIDFIRDEIKFKSIDELKMRIESDLSKI